MMMVTLEPTGIEQACIQRHHYVFYALCYHFHYSLADVLRMSSFTIVAHAEYGHELPMSEINR